MVFRVSSAVSSPISSSPAMTSFTTTTTTAHHFFTSVCRTESKSLPAKMAAKTAKLSASISFTAIETTSEFLSTLCRG